MPNIEESEGYKKLLDSVKHDVDKGEGCFNPNGCNHEFYRTVPEENEDLHAIGMKTACKCVSKCFHKYCDKFKWVIDRANHYAEKIGLDPINILNAWESQRSYWYMNFYQDSKQPEIKEGNVRVFDTINDLSLSMGDQGFRCPACKGIASSPYECDSGLEMSKGRICDWKTYGFLGTLGKGVSVFVKEKIAVQTIFMPIAWEKKIQSHGQLGQQLEEAQFVQPVSAVDW